jgi:hypothetical protein
VLTGWGEGVAGLAAGLPDAGARLVPVPTPAVPGDRFRRATRECLLAVSVARAAVRQAGLPDDAVAGPDTGIVYASAMGYAAANRAFLEDEGATTLHFPYTAPSAVPGEVTIELGIRGPYVNLMGGGPATLEALGLAARWLADGVAARVLVLAVEAAHEVRDLLARAAPLLGGPLAEGAACLLLEPAVPPAAGAPSLRWASALASRGRADDAVGAVLDAVAADGPPDTVEGGALAGALARAEARALRSRGWPPARPALGGRSEALAVGPLLALARGPAAAGRDRVLTAAWRNEYGAMRWPAAAPARP